MEETQTTLTIVLKWYLFAHDTQFSEYMMLVAVVGQKRNLFATAH
jgi:hypothetical protein